MKISIKDQILRIHAYDKIYLDDAMTNLGDCVDYAINVLNVDVDLLQSCMNVAWTMRQFETGNPSWLAGHNGCEFAKQLLRDIGLDDYEDVPDIMEVDKSPEYWAGWVLAYYQWYRGISFKDIFNAINLKEVISLYYPYHEADISKTVEILEERVDKSKQKTKLQIHRGYSGLSQRQLAERSGVPVRQIQLFEQRQRDINKTSGETLFRLAKSLSCKMEDLLER